MVDYLVYGKIIVDVIRLLDGSVVRSVLGGGGPQGAFGARLWDSSVGLLSRSGTDIEENCSERLRELDIDLAGWMQYPDIPTPHGIMAYNEDEYINYQSQLGIDIDTLNRNLQQILAVPIELPESYQNPKVIHLITEYFDEDMVQTALDLRQKGAILSLEPLIDYREWTNRQSMHEFFKVAQTATPDWPSASGFAGSDEPLEVMKYWAKLGPDLVCVRHGSRGSYVWDKNHDEIWQIPPVKVNVIDPTGAGNSYGGGMSVGWHKTKNALYAGCYGAISASLIIREVGTPMMTSDLQTEAQALVPLALEQAKKL